MKQEIVNPENLIEVPKPQRKHYHVISGMRGYMPDRNEVSLTRREAEQDARIFAEEIRDDENVESRCVRGSASAGWYAITDRRAGVEYIEITSCTMPDCLEDTP